MQASVQMDRKPRRVRSVVGLQYPRFSDHSLARKPNAPYSNGQKPREGKSLHDDKQRRKKPAKAANQPVRSVDMLVVDQYLHVNDREQGDEKENVAGGNEG